MHRCGKHIIASVVKQHTALRLLLSLFITIFSLSNGLAMNIQEIKSEKGISAWLVQDSTVPIFVMSFAFMGGASQDPVGKEGLHYVLSTLIDEGAGDMNAKAFQEAMQDIAMDMSFHSDRDSFEGTMRTLSPNRAEAVKLLNLALTKARFDADAVTRMKAQISASLKSDSENPDRIAANLWSAKAFPNHAYGRPSNGTIESIAKITSDDLRTTVKNTMARNNLKVVIVGNVSLEDAKKTLDDAFDGLPETAQLQNVPKIEMALTPALTVDVRKVAQTTLIFGQPGILRQDPDFIPATVVMHMLGGGGLNSRLFKEVREKRGLTYGVYSSLEAYESTGVIAGSMSTGNDKAKEALTVIQDEFAKMADVGPEAEELVRAKAYLVGSFPLRLDSSRKIAAQLLAYMQQNLPIDYIDQRRKLIEGVSMDDAKKVAKRLLKSPMLVVAVGDPKGLK